MGEPVNRPKRWWPVAVIILALTGWGILLAAGAYLELGGDGTARDPRKFWMVIGCVSAFLALWGVALWFRSARAKRNRP